MNNIRFKNTARTYTADYEYFVREKKTVVFADFDAWQQKQLEEILVFKGFLSFLQGYDVLLKKELAKEKNWYIANDDYHSFLLKPYIAGNADIIPDTSCEIIEEEYGPNGHILMKLTLPIVVTIESDEEEE